MDAVSRRGFLGAGAAMPAASYARTMGANDPIQSVLLGCGHRSSGHRIMLKKAAVSDPNFEIRNVCDLWSMNRERAAADVRRLSGNNPRKFQYSEEMPADQDLDAVMIATGGHQHARILADVHAGKDCQSRSLKWATSRRSAGRNRKREEIVDHPVSA